MRTDSNQETRYQDWLTSMVPLGLLILALIFGEWRGREDHESLEKVREREYQRLGLRQGRDYMWVRLNGERARIRLHPDGRRRLGEARRQERISKKLQKQKCGLNRRKEKTV